MGDISNGTRILLTQYLLKRLTDENHALSREDLIKKIGGLGTTISSNTIKADIESIKTYNEILKECHDELLAPFSCQENGEIAFTTKQKRGAFVEKSYYSDTELVLLSRLLGQGLTDNVNLNLLEKVLTDTSLYKIDSLSLLDGVKNKQNSDNCLVYLEQIITAINNDSSISFKHLNYKVVNGQLLDVTLNKTIQVYPTNINIKEGKIYFVGYKINSGETFEFVSYPVERITQLKIARTAKHVREKINGYKEQKWKVNDPLNIGCNNKIDLKLRIYLGHEDILEMIIQHFNQLPIVLEQFRQFVDILVEDVDNDDQLLSWFLQLSNQVEVLKPVELREKIKDAINQTIKMYRY